MTPPAERVDGHTEPLGELLLAVGQLTEARHAERNMPAGRDKPTIGRAVRG